MAKHSMRVVPESRDRRKLPIRWPVDVDLPVIYANQLLISHAGPEYMLVFGVLEPPMLVNPTEAELEKIKEVVVRPVAKIAISLEAMPGIAKVINTNVQNFLRMVEELSKQQDEAVSREGATQPEEASRLDETTQTEAGDES